MAKSKGKGPARPSKQARAASRRFRNAAGRFVSAEDASYSRAELIERRKQTQAKKSRLDTQRLNRAREVYAVRADQKKRSRFKGKLRKSYSAKAPQTTYRTTSTRGAFKITLIRFHGSDAIYQAQHYLDERKDVPYRRYRINIGTGYTRNDEWVGSKTEDRRGAIGYLSRVTQTQSAQTVVGGDDEQELWVEIEIFDRKGRSSRVGSKQSIKKSKRTRRKPTRRTIRGQSTNRATSTKRRTQSSKTSKARKTSKNLRLKGKRNRRG